MQLLDGEYQIPIFTPNDVAILQLKGIEQLLVKIFIVLRMRMTTDVVTNIHNARGVIVEEQVHRQVAHSLCPRNVQCSHNYNLSLILVVFTIRL